MTPTKPLSQEEYDALIRDEIAKLEGPFLAKQVALETGRAVEAEPAPDTAPEAGE